MRLEKVIYYIATAVMSLVFLFSAYMYLTKHEMVVGFYDQLGFPSWMIYPSAIAKILGVIAIWSRLSNFIKEWAYAGFFFDAAMAFTAHTIAEDGGSLFSIIALVSLVISRFMEWRIFGSLKMQKD